MGIIYWRSGLICIGRQQEISRHHSPAAIKSKATDEDVVWCGVVWCGTLYDVRSNSCSFSPSPSHMSIGCVGGTFKTLLLYCTVQSRVREQKAGETISVLHEKRPERDTAAPYSYLSKLCRTSFASTSMSRPTVSAWHSVVMSLSSHTTPSLRVVLTSNLTL